MMLPVEEAEHFVRAPEWTWYILFYFFLAGISGGSYAVATLLRLRGDRSDGPAARLGYYVALPTLVVCPILLILDLGKPLRFWHMMWNTTPDSAGLNFKSWAPMSVGVWALTLFAVFVVISFVESLVHDERLRVPLAHRAVGLLDGTAGTVVSVIGAILGLFVASYTGVLLAVTNQPVWSDTWALGGLFLASGLSGSVAVLLLLTRYRPAARSSTEVLVVSERLYTLLELVLIVIFALTLISAGTVDDAFGFPWLLLWLVAFAGLVPGLWGLVTTRLAVTGEGVTVPAPAAALGTTLAPALVVLGVLALRAAVIFSIQ